MYVENFFNNFSLHVTTETTTTISNTETCPPGIQSRRTGHVHGWVNGPVEGGGRCQCVDGGLGVVATSGRSEV